MLARIRTPSPIRCIDFDSKNTFIAVGMMLGVIGVYFLNIQRTESRPMIREERNNDDDYGTYTLHELVTRKDCQEDISGNISVRRLYAIDILIYIFFKS